MTLLPLTAMELKRITHDLQLEAAMKRRISERITALLEYRTGLIDIPTLTQKFIATHFSFLLFTTIPGVFINTFFFRQDGKISTVALYNAISVFGLAIVMQLSSQISLKKSPVFILRIGVVLYNIFYIILLLLQGNAVKYTVLLGILSALANGFYWQSYNELVKITTSEKIFDRVVSLMGMVSSFVNLVVPLISGIIISTFGGQLGYNIIFAISFLFSLCTTFLATKLGDVKIVGVSNLSGTYRYVFSSKKIFGIFAAEFFRGIKNTAYPLFLNIIFFKMITNEAILGLNTTLCGLTAIFSFILAGRIIRPRNRLQCVLISSVISTIVSIPLLVYMKPLVLFILSIANALVAAFLDNPSVGIFYTAFEKPIDGISFSQLLSTREVFFGAGRVVGLTMLVLLSRSSFMFAVFALIVNASTLLTWLLYKGSVEVKMD